MGMPGVGKGTQAVRLRDRLGVPHVSTGDILREAIGAGTALGRRVQGCLDSGALVPDDLVGEVIAERLGRRDARDGFILDGFPRTVEQVAILERILTRLGIVLDGVYLLTAPTAEIVRRLAGRRVCPKCRDVYHVDHRPPRSGIEDHPSLRLGGVADPPLPRRNVLPVWEKQRPDRLGREDPIEDAILRPVGHDDRFARGSGQPGGSDFAPHSART